MFVWAALAAFGTFVIAAVAVGSVTGRLARSPRRSVYDLDEAVEFVAAGLPDELTAELSFDEVRAVLGYHCDYLAEKGLASTRTADDIGTGLVVVPDDEPVAYVIGRLEAAGLTVADDAVATVLDVEQGYYEAIGAIGPRVVGPPDPDGEDPTPTAGSPTMNADPADGSTEEE